MKDEMMMSQSAFSRSSKMKRVRLISVAAVLLVCCLAFVGVVGASETAGITYTIISDTTVKVMDGKSCTGDVVIPEKVTIDSKEYTVTEIAPNAFNDVNEVTSVVVPNSVTTLGGAAFANMDKLISITIGNGVTSWGSKLAVNNYELTTVVIAEGATLIGDTAFRTCPKLSDVTLPSTLETIGGTAFAYSAIEELNIPASVTTIGGDAFKDIDTLKTVTFNSVPTSLGTTVFQMCDGLETVTLPEGLTSIPQGTFRYCTSLKNINFPESLTEIGNYAFQGCTSLESVTISKNIDNLVTNAFNGCTSLKDLIIEEGFNGTIGGYVFQGCTALESVVIPSSMETVGESMFNMCSSLTSVTLSEGVKTLNINAFANCGNLKYLTIPDSMERMRHGSIANCVNLEYLVILGENLPVIEYSNALDGLSDDIVVVYNGEDPFTGNWASLADNEPEGFVIFFNTDGGSEITPIIKDSGTDVTAPNDPTKDGYEFSAWDQEIPSQMPDKNLIITAKWKANTYTIIFEANGAESGTMANQEFTYDGEQKLTPNAFTRTGYSFTGWKTNADGSEGKYNDGASVKKLTTENNGKVSLYANWAANTYTVIFKANGGEGTMDDQEFTYDGEQKLTPNAFTRTGYSFTGWKTNADGSEGKYNDEASVINLTPENDGEVTLYANWAANTYTVIFEVNGAESGTMANQVFTYDKEQSLTPNAFTKTGYTFNSWNTNDNGSGVKYDDKASVKNLTPENEDTVILYANWTINQYTITFNTDGGSSVAPITQNYGTDVTAPNNPTKDGYTFAGWDKEIPAIMPADNMTVTALWEANLQPTSSGSSGISGYKSHSRTTENGGLVDFGTSKVVKSLMLPEGSSGSVILKVDTIEGWTNILETEYTFDISVEKLGDGMAYILFEIPLSTLERFSITPDDICVYHLVDGIWIKLVTTYDVKERIVYYEAETDSFSPFKLVFEEGAATPKAEETEPVIPPTEEPENKPEDIAPPIDEPTKPSDEPETPAPLLAVLAGLGAAVVLRRK